jgi:hypothetical protein
VNTHLYKKDQPLLYQQGGLTKGKKNKGLDIEQIYGHESQRGPMPGKLLLLLLELKFRVSGVGSWQNIGKKGIRERIEDFIVCCSYSETVINPLPGYD